MAFPHSPRLGELAIIGDLHTCALIDRRGSVEWLCLPNLADEALFAALLDPAVGGAFVIGSKGKDCTERCYIEGSHILKTRFEDAAGVFTVTDLMVLKPEGISGRLEPERELVRIIEAEAGKPSVSLIYQPRPRYGQAPQIKKRGRNGWTCRHRSDLLLFRTDLHVDVETPDCIAGCETLSSGERRYASLSFTRRDVGIVPSLGTECEEKRATTATWWKQWVSKSRYRGDHRREVERSLTTLRLLASCETGAVVAAATTSSPEWIGAGRNWDYRYCWLRDAYFVLSAFMRSGLHQEARDYFSWLMHATQLDKPRIKPMYDVFGRSDLKERTLPHLRGFRGSSPVRIGNGAAGQLQLDGYGSVILAACELIRGGGDIGRSEAARLRGFADSVCELWNRPDSGIWEMRGEPMHHVYSKAMCWAALDGFLWLANNGSVRIANAKYKATRDELRASVLEHGWNPRRQAFTGAYGKEHLDASVLLLPKLGIISPSDPRMCATFERIEEELTEGACVWRYDPAVDGLNAPEGSFVACGFWAAEYLALAGNSDAAQCRFKILLGASNDLDLFAEEFEPSSKTMLGNFPQGLSHAALIHTAFALQPCSTLDGKSP